MIDPAIRKGLAGVVVDTTEISMVDEASNSLTYRGYPVQDLAASCTVEEEAHLLWYGELPTAAQLSGYCARERTPHGRTAYRCQLPGRGRPRGGGRLGPGQPRQGRGDDGETARDRRRRPPAPPWSGPHPARSGSGLCRQLLPHVLRGGPRA